VTIYFLEYLDIDGLIVGLTGMYMVNLIILALYVDDGLIASTDEQELVDFINQLKNEFKITVNDARYFLGIQIDQNSDGSIMLSQPMQEEN